MFCIKLLVANGTWRVTWTVSWGQSYRMVIFKIILPLLVLLPQSLKCFFAVDALNKPFWFYSNYNDNHRINSVAHIWLFLWSLLLPECKRIGKHHGSHTRKLYRYFKTTHDYFRSFLLPERQWISETEDTFLFFPSDSISGYNIMWKAKYFLEFL